MAGTVHKSIIRRKIVAAQNLAHTTERHENGSDARISQVPCLNSLAKEPEEIAGTIKTNKYATNPKRYSGAAYP